MSMAQSGARDSPANRAGAVSPSGADDDLEDGEIFDDDEPAQVFKGGGCDDKPLASETPSTKEQAFKQSKGNSSNADRKKGQKDRDKRSDSKESRQDKRSDRSGCRNNASAAKRKRGRDSEDDHRPTKSKQRKVAEKNKGNQSTLQLEDDVDENEMVYVMGGNSPTAAKQQPDWEMFSDEEDAERDKDTERGGGARGARRGREGFHSSGRMSRRARLSRGAAKRNRFPRKQNNDLTICKFFMQGKCQRGSDCPFSHTALPSKKMELCKFYMNDCCTKRDKCLYMHGDFPCKFYHTGQKCYAGKRCKFYHGKISNFLRSVLMKHLENRELQKEFDKYSELYEKKDRDRARDRDRDRFPDRRRSRSDEEEGGSTPMPSPQRDEFASDREPTPDREREKRERRRRRAKRRSREDEEKNREYYEDPEYYQDEQPPADYDNHNHNWTAPHHHQYNHTNYHNHNYNENHQFANDDYPEPEDGDVEPDPLPANMPATQRKLFMRIQQQQHTKQTDQLADNESREEEFKEENWYSSDEESASNPLNTIFRNVPGLNQMQQANTKQPTPLMSTPMQPPGPMLGAPMQPPPGPGPMLGAPMQPPPGPGPMLGAPMQPPPGAMLPPGPLMSNPPMQNNVVMTQCPPMPLMSPLMPMPQNMAPMPNAAMFDNIDLSAVTKILSSVRESMKINADGNDPGRTRTPPVHVQSPSSSPTSSQPHHDDRRFRDPRLRGQEASDRSKAAASGSIKPALPAPSLPGPVLLTQADLDLRLSSSPPQLSLEPAGSDVDLRHLPFKPAPLHQAANEIDASMSRGPPIEWKLSLLSPFKPDYSLIASRSNPQTCANDPRLRKYATPQVLAQSQLVVAQALPPQGTTSSPPQNRLTTRVDEPPPSRDPRNRGVANDPRRRNHDPRQQQPRPARPDPPTDPPRHDNDLRLGILSQIPQLSSLVLPNRSDTDLRVQQSHYYQ